MANWISNPTGIAVTRNRIDDFQQFTSATWECHRNDGNVAFIMWHITVPAPGNRVGEWIVSREAPQVSIRSNRKDAVPGEAGRFKTMAQAKAMVVAMEYAPTVAETATIEPETAEEAAKEAPAETAKERKARKAREARAVKKAAKEAPAEEAPAVADMVAEEGEQVHAMA